jgi:hypothetical protein
MAIILRKNKDGDFEIEDTNPGWDNWERRRYYGHRVGDMVKLPKLGRDCPDEIGEVVGYDATDNNAIYVMSTSKTSKGDNPSKEVAEWCVTVLKVEDMKARQRTNVYGLKMGDRLDFSMNGGTYALEAAHMTDKSCWMKRFPGKSHGMPNRKSWVTVNRYVREFNATITRK